MRPATRIRSTGLVLAGLVVMLLVLADPLDSFGENPTISRKIFISESVSSNGIQPHDLARDDNGLVYFVYLANCPGCSVGGAPCSDARLAVVHSGYNAAILPVVIPGPDWLNSRRISMDLAEGPALNTLHFGWNGRDDCASNLDQVYFGTGFFDKRDPDSIHISSYERVNDGPQPARQLDVVAGIGDTLHFAWCDARCTPDTIGNGSIFYRRKQGDTWIPGDQSNVCNTGTGWADSPMLVNYNCSTGQDTCCPRASEASCTPPDSCPKFMATTAIILPDQNGTVTIVWKDTDKCEALGYKKPDVIDYREYRPGAGFGEVKRLGHFEPVAFDASMTPDGTVVAAWEDRIEVAGVPICGLWCALKAPEDSEFSDPYLLYEASSGEDCPADSGVIAWKEPNYLRMACDLQSFIHFVFEDTENGPTGSRSVIRYGVVHKDSLKPDTPVYPIYTVMDGGTASSATEPNIEVDACGNAHIFFAYEGSRLRGVNGTYYHKVVSFNDTSTVALHEPNGGETWYVGDTYTIRWKLCPQLDDTITTQAIYVTREDMTGWICLEDGVDPLARAYDWTPSGPPSDECRIKIIAERLSWENGDWVTADTLIAYSESTFELECGVDPDPPVVDPDLSTLTVKVDGIDLDSLTVCPCGEMESLEVTATLKDSLNAPLSSLCCQLAVDLSPVGEEDTVLACAGNPLFTSAMTDSEGRITLSVAELGGCWDIDVEATAFGTTLTDKPRIVMNSPDINGDHVVDVADFTEFSSMYLSSAWCGDFNKDGIVDVEDFTTFSFHYLDECPEPLYGRRAAVMPNWSRTSSATLIEPWADQGSADLYGFPIVADGLDCEDYVAIEMLVSYDAEGGEPARWDGRGDLHFVNIEEFALNDQVLNFARVVTLLDGVSDSRDDVVGVLQFRRLGGAGAFSPDVVQVLGLRDGIIEDITSFFQGAAAGLKVGDRSLALRPMLEVFPNPAKGPANLRYGVPADMGKRITLSVFDVRGRMVARVYEGPNDGYVMRADIASGHGPTDIPAPGIYFIRLAADGHALKSEKMVLVK
jgi:hypothetical protein